VCRYQNLHQNLASVLLDYVKTAPPAFLERLVVELLVAMGYVGSLTPGPGDGQVVIAAPSV
jgi:restriction endonuclease Mrr